MIDFDYVQEDERELDAIYPELEDDYQPAGTAANLMKAGGPAAAPFGADSDGTMSGTPGASMMIDDAMYSDPLPGPERPPAPRMGGAGDDYEMYPEAGAALPAAALPAAAGPVGASDGVDYEMYPEADAAYPDAAPGAAPGPTMPGTAYAEVTEMYPEPPPPLLPAKKEVTAASLVAGNRVTEEDLIAQAEDELRYGRADDRGWNPNKVQFAVSFAATANIHLKYFQRHDSRFSASVDQYAARIESVETRQRLEAKAKAMAANRHEYDDVADGVGSGAVETAYHVIDSDEEDSVDPFELYKMQKAEAAAVRWQ